VIWWLLLGACSLLWAVGIGLGRSWDRKVAPLPRRAETSGAYRACVSVLIPARNEESDLASTLTALLAQSWTNLEIIVVDDHSTDATGRVAEEAAARDRRVRVLHHPELRPGWHGKPNALDHALGASSGEYVLMIDADVTLAADVIERAVAALDQRGIEGLTLLDTICAGSWVEVTALPFKYLAAALVPPVFANDESTRFAFANGPFILVRRRVFERFSFEQIRRSIPVDVSMAAALLETGTRLYVLQAYGEVVRAQVYGGGVRGFVTGIAKNVTALLGGPKSSVYLGTLAALLLAAFTWFPMGVLFAALYLGAPALAVGAALAYAVPLVMSLFPGPAFRGRFGFLPLYPLSALLILTGQLTAAYFAIHRGSVRWRGRETLLHPSPLTDGRSSPPSI